MVKTVIDCIYLFFKKDNEKFQIEKLDTYKRFIYIVLYLAKLVAKNVN